MNPGQKDYKSTVRLHKTKLKRNTNRAKRSSWVWLSYNIVIWQCHAEQISNIYLKPKVSETNILKIKKKIIWKQQLIYLRTNNLRVTGDSLIKWFWIIWPKQIPDHVRLLAWKPGSSTQLWTSLPDYNRITGSRGMVT